MARSKTPRAGANTKQAKVTIANGAKGHGGAPGSGSQNSIPGKATETPARDKRRGLPAPMPPRKFLG